jgi:hypothetical protein
MQKSSFPDNLIPVEFSSKDFGKHAQALTERVCQSARQIAEGAGRPYVYLNSAQTNKEALIEQIARRDRISEGLVAILSAVEPCVVIGVRGDAPDSRAQTQNGSKTHQWQRLRRSVVDLPRRAQVSRAANRRYLQAIASTQCHIALGQAFEALTLPKRWHDGRRYRGLNPLNPEDSTLLRAVARGEWTLSGFRNRDIRRCIFKAPPTDPRQARSQSALIGRRLRLLCAHGIIRKIPRTQRYILTPNGRNLITLLVAAQQADTQKLTALAA